MDLAVQAGSPGQGREPRESASTSAAKEYVCGFAAGGAGVVSGYPFDALKVRPQACTTTAEAGMWRCAVQAFRHEGVSLRMPFPHSVPPNANTFTLR